MHKYLQNASFVIVTKVTKLLLANGCSHTAGAEIEYAHQGECYDNAWPRWLADDLGYNWINIARSGASNSYIQRTTINWVAQNIEVNKTYAPSDVVVMIMWSGFDRFEVWNDARKQLKSYSGMSDLSGESALIQDYVKSQTTIDTSEVNEYRSLLNIFLTARYLESVGVKYYFMNALHIFKWHSLFTTPGIKDEYCNLHNAYGQDRTRLHLGFYYPKELFRVQLKHLPYSKHAKNGHWGVVGQKYWKDILIDKYFKELL